MITEFAGYRFECRDGTSDWNTVASIVIHDEYKLNGLALDGKLLFDIGAHVGALSVVAASRGAAVIALEPLPENVVEIHRNAKLNGVEIDVIQGAMSLQEIVRVQYSNDGHHTFIGNALGITSADEGIDVQGLSFDALCEYAGVPDIVKIDCEGGEWDAFKSEAIREVRLVAGEYHGPPGRAGVLDTFGATHEIEWDPTADDYIGVFWARR